MKRKDITLSDPPIFQHIERFLGRIKAGSSVSFKLDHGTLQVLRHRDRPCARATTYCTLGISRHALSSGEGRWATQELIFCCYRRFEHANIPCLLASVAHQDILDAHTLLQRGTVLGPGGPLLPKTKLSAFYCAGPVYFPDEFFVCYETSPPTNFTWLIPISAEEAGFIHDEGVEAFEDYLLRHDPDLLDLGRDAMSPRGR